MTKIKRFFLCTFCSAQEIFIKEEEEAKKAFFLSSLTSKISIQLEPKAKTKSLLVSFTVLDNKLGGTKRVKNKLILKAHLVVRIIIKIICHHSRI